MPGLIPVLLFALAPAAQAADYAASLDMLPNKLDVEMALHAEGVERDVGLVFSFAVPGVPELRYDRIDGVMNIVESEQTTVGFLQLSPTLVPQTAIFRQERGGDLCMDSTGQQDLEAAERLAVYTPRAVEQALNQARLVLGVTDAGQGVMTVWIEPGEQVTTVSVEDHRRGRKARRTELKQADKTLTLERDGAGSRACYQQTTAADQ